jgi:hypothetical protein
MPALPSEIQQYLIRLEDELRAMPRGTDEVGLKPHKLVMLLAVLDRADRGLLQENRIVFDEALCEAFANYFQLVSTKKDWCQPGPPFFHLRSSPFWLHKVRAGHESAYAALTTSGGGTKRILDHIEYAYFSDYAFATVQDKEGRHLLRQFVTALLNPEGTRGQRDGPATDPAGARPINRLGAVFHEAFSLSRPALKAVLEVRMDPSTATSWTPETARDELLRQRTGLGTRQVKAVPRYAVGAGLLGAAYAATKLGAAVSIHDPLLETSATQWLMHYHLSAPHGPGPAFWHDVVVSHFKPGQEFTSNDIAAHISDFVERTEGKRLAPRSAQSTATVMLGSYTKPDGLQRLGLLESLSDGRFRVQEPEPPPVAAFGVALVDYWQARFGSRLTVNLDELSGDRGLGSLFLVGSGRLGSLLRSLQAEGYVDVYRVAPPYQVVLLRPDMDSLLGWMYGTNHIS